MSEHMDYEEDRVRCLIRNWAAASRYCDRVTTAVGLWLIVAGGALIASDVRPGWLALVVGPGIAAQWIGYAIAHRLADRRHPVPPRWNLSMVARKPREGKE